MAELINIADEGLWTLDELQSLYRSVDDEIQRRQTLLYVPQAITFEAVRYLEARDRRGRFNDPSNTEAPQWVQPTGAHDAYPMEYLVRFSGKVWESTVANNVWTPGGSGWREVVAKGAAPAEFIQPTGAHDVYNKGDQVTFISRVYESVIDNNSWSPSTYPSGWKLVV